MDKWHYYLNGKHDITVRSDHQPLDTIFKKPLNRAPPLPPPQISKNDAEDAELSVYRLL